MSVLPTFVDSASEEYQRNYAVMRALLDEFEQRQETVRQGGGESGQRKFRERGKLLPRERVELLLDPGTPFLELSTLAAWGMYNDESPGASGINGIGVVSGVECMICANDATAKGGASYPMSVKKALARAGDRRAQPPALRLSRRVGGRESALPGRVLRRPRRAHVCQPVAHVGGGHPADRARLRLLHRWRRLCARPLATTP